MSQLRILNKESEGVKPPPHQIHENLINANVIFTISLCELQHTYDCLNQTAHHKDIEEADNKLEQAQLRAVADRLWR